MLCVCVVCINGRMYVCCSDRYVVSNEYDKPTEYLVRTIGADGGEIMYFGSFVTDVSLIS